MFIHNNIKNDIQLKLLKVKCDTRKLIAYNEDNKEAVFTEIFVPKQGN